GGELREPNQAIEAKKDDSNDEQRFPLQIGIHTRTGLTASGEPLTLLRFRLDLGDGRPGYLDFYLVGNAKLDRVALDADNGAVDAAAGDYLVGRFRRPQHLGRLLLASLRGADPPGVDSY